MQRYVNLSPGLIRREFHRKTCSLQIAAEVCIMQLRGAYMSRVLGIVRESHEKDRKFSPWMLSMG